MNLTRRHFTQLLGSLAFTGLSARLAHANQAVAGYGALVPDPNGLIDLPSGFSYRVISELGAAMSDGYSVPDRADGMGCFPLDENRVALVRNHELKPTHAGGPFNGPMTGPDKVYDMRSSGTPLPGGTTTLVYNMVSGKVEREYLSLAGTIRNCAGGTTPWGSWLTCEEDVTRAGDGVDKDHGWVFEVPARADGLVDPVPLKAMGRFNHEAAAVDPRTGIVYLTEDRDDSLFYRFLPDTPGNLAAGGRLQALGMTHRPSGSDSRNWSQKTWATGDWRDAIWIDLDETLSPEDDLRERGHRKGATLFARGEGIHWGDGELYFCCTSGGTAQLGQIMRYRPSAFEGTEQEPTKPSRLQLFLESTDPQTFNFGDNLTVAPNGHLIVCEDQYTDDAENYIRGVTPDGAPYDFARVRIQTEPAGGCFSPDGSTLFVNLYSPTRTLAITGPWNRFVS